MLIAFLDSGCMENKPVFENFTGFAQGSTYSVVYENTKKIDQGELREKVDRIIE